MIRRIFVLGLLTTLPWIMSVPLVKGAEFDDCTQCHQDAAQAFSRSAMSKAAVTQDFMAEWSEHRHQGDCLTCHAPSGGGGVQCRDCHGSQEHPVDKVGVPEVCARCHSAPGENTVKTYLLSRSFEIGEDCLDCHSDRNGENVHLFKGPMIDDGFLDGVVRMRAGIWRNSGGINGSIRISHRAGHSLPGGTTGRAVWLVTEGLDRQGKTVWSDRFRFGWEHDEDGNWRDRTLKPDDHVQVKLEDIGRLGAKRLHAVLYYQFAAGDFNAVPAESQRVLDELQVKIADSLVYGEN